MPLDIGKVVTFHAQALMVARSASISQGVQASWEVEDAGLEARFTVEHDWLHAKPGRLLICPDAGPLKGALIVTAASFSFGSESGNNLIIEASAQPDSSGVFG